MNSACSKHTVMQLGIHFIYLVIQKMQISWQLQCTWNADPKELTTNISKEPPCFRKHWILISILPYKKVKTTIMSKNHTEKDAFHFRTLNDKKNIYCLTWQYILVYQTWVQRVTSDLYEALKNAANNLQYFCEGSKVYFNLVTLCYVTKSTRSAVTSLVSNVPMSFHFQSHNLKSRNIQQYLK